MLDIYQVETDDQRREVRALFNEYLRWASTMFDPEIVAQVAAEFDIDALVEQAMTEVTKFYPPHGRLLIARVDD